jgi:hypothetical protein
MNKVQQYICFAIVPLGYIILMFFSNRINSLHSFFTLVLYLVLCILFGVLSVRLFLYNKYKFQERVIIIWILVIIDQVLKLLVSNVNNLPITIIPNVLKISISKNFIRMPYLIFLILNVI